MTQYTDYNFYMNTYMGDMPKKYFDKLVIRASAEVQKNISNRDITNYKDEVQSATCSVADILFEIEQAKERKSKLMSSENQVIASESVADYSRTFATANNIKDLDEEISNQKAKIKEEIRTYLVDTGLLYRGG